MSTHQHEAVHERGPYGYTGPVSYTDENRAAHGNVMFVEECSCGYERPYLVNGRHVEWGVWSPGEDLLRERRERERERRESEARRRKAEALLARAREVLPSGRYVYLPHDVTLDLRGLDVNALLSDDTEVLVQTGDDWQRHRIGTLRRAAHEWADQPDSEPGRVYGAIGEALP